MSHYSSQVSLGAVVTFEHLQPFMVPPQTNCDTLYKIAVREPADPVTRETVVECDKDGKFKSGSKPHKIVLQFVNLVQ